MSQAVHLLNAVRRWRDDTASETLAAQTRSILRSCSDAQFCVSLPVYPAGLTPMIHRAIRYACDAKDLDARALWLELVADMVRLAEKRPKPRAPKAQKRELAPGADLKKLAAGDET